MRILTGILQRLNDSNVGKPSSATTAKDQGHCCTGQKSSQSRKITETVDGCCQKFIPVMLLKLERFIGLNFWYQIVWSRKSLLKSCNYSLFTKLRWPGNSEGTFQYSNQAATCPTVYHTRLRLHTSLFIAERKAGNCLFTAFLLLNVKQVPFLQQTLSKLDHGSIYIIIQMAVKLFYLPALISVFL